MGGVGLTETVRELGRRSNVTLMGGPLFHAFCLDGRDDVSVAGVKTLEYFLVLTELLPLLDPGRRWLLSSIIATGRYGNIGRTNESHFVRSRSRMLEAVVEIEIDLLSKFSWMAVIILFEFKAAFNVAWCCNCGMG